MSLNFAVRIKTQYLQSNLRENAITPGVVRKSIQYFILFLNKPIRQLGCMNFGMFLPLYSIKGMENIYRSVIQCVTFEYVYIDGEAIIYVYHYAHFCHIGSGSQ